MSAFQISPIGIVIIAIYSFLIGIVVLFLSRQMKNVRWRWWLLAPPALLLMALPWAEEAWIAWHFNEACKEAGVTVYRQVEVEGFYDSTMQSGYERIRDGGFRFMEHQSDAAGKIEHLERVQGQWEKTVLSMPIARYRYMHIYQPEPSVTEEQIGWKLTRSGTQVIDSQTGEILGRSLSFTRLPNIADWQWIRFLGRGGRSCSDPEKGPLQPAFPEAVLKPVAKQLP